MTGRTYWRTLLAASVAISVAGNTGHVLLTQADHRVAAAAWAAVPPLMLAAITHGMAATAGAGVRRWIYRAGVTGAVCIALMAFAVSFVALREVSILLGCPPAVAALMPLIVDAAIAVSTTMVLAVRPEDSPAVHAVHAVHAPDAADASHALPDAPLEYPAGLAWMGDAGPATRDLDLAAETAPEPVVSSADAAASVDESVEDQVLRMHQRGDSQPTIAAAIGKSQSTVSRMLKRLEAEEATAAA